MVLESLVNPAIAKQKPWETFLLGSLYAVVGLFLSYWVFPEYSSMIMVFLITLAAVPLLFFTVNSEEEFDTKLAKEGSILHEHFRVIVFLMMFFFGTTASLVVLYIFLPTGMVTTIFSSQSQTILAINNNVSGGVVNLSAFGHILMNNLRVLVFSILFSFLYGIGSLFILMWNSTVIAAAIGNFIRSHLSEVVASTQLSGVGSYFQIFSVGFLRYAVHGIPEVIAYFIGGLAGGILSVAVIKHDIFSDKRDRIFSDATELVLLGLATLIIAAFIEVYITPILF